MDDIVICAPVRTPIGRYGGALRDVASQGLAAQVLRALVDRSGLDPTAVDDVILGQGYPSGEQPAIGRVAALDAGLPTTVTGAQVDRRCASGLYAVVVAAGHVATGGAELLVAGGVESMSQAEYYAQGLRFGHPAPELQLHDRLGRARVTSGGERYPIPGGMLETAENLRREFAIGRQEQDELALRSHQRATAAIADGRFEQEIVPVAIPGGATPVSTDEHPRADTSLAALAKLPPLLRDVDPTATVTAGNASGQNDGAAACIVTRRTTADRLGLQPCLRLVSWALAGVDPRRMGIGPVPASEQALERAGIRLRDIDLIELNEAFAAQVLAVLRLWELGEADHERLNVNGSGISLGHPIGATGARILTTLAHELNRRDGRYGLATLCIGGGQGLAAVFERLP